MKKNSTTKLADEQRKEIIDMASRVAIEQYRKEADRMRKAAQDKRLYNTKLLMEKYRGFVIHSRSAVYDAAQIDGDFGLDALLDLMGCGEGTRQLSVSSVQESAARTRILVHHIDQMLGYYRYRCELSSKPEDARRYRVIKAMYIDEIEKSPQELADAETVDVSTIYKDLKAALRQLSALIFGYFD